MSWSSSSAPPVRACINVWGPIKGTYAISRVAYYVVAANIVSACSSRRAPNSDTVVIVVKMVAFNIVVVRIKQVYPLGEVKSRISKPIIMTVDIVAPDYVTVSIR